MHLSNYVEFSLGEYYFLVIFWLSFAMMDLKNALDFNEGISGCLNDSEKVGFTSNCNLKYS
ncbi:hypothetical protein NIES2134_123710 [Thermostichus vulcanus NIES-2134]|nr:hypothetical protein NIES2134_123710 [Thermostichus vulcanus NIES-2134]